MVIEIEGCIYPRCNGGIDCPLTDPPSRCELDLTEDDKLIVELEKKVEEGKQAAKKLYAIRRRDYIKKWNAEHREQRNKYMKERYQIRKEKRAKENANT